MRRAIALAALLLTLGVLAGCGDSRPDVRIEEASLTPYADRTVVSIRVFAARYKQSYFTVQPTQDAVLRDNLGNEYHVLDGTGDLDGRIGGGLLYPETRQGTLVFPVLAEGATAVNISMPIYSDRGAMDVIFLGGAPDEPDWRIGATWYATEDGFVREATYVADSDGRVVAAGK